MSFADILHLTWAQWIGIAGFVSYLTAFISVQHGYLNGNTAIYSAWNVLSASLVLISLTENFNIASVLIQVSWIVVGTYGVLRHVEMTTARRALRRPLKVAAFASFFLTAIFGMSLMASSSADEGCYRAHRVIYTASITPKVGGRAGCRNEKGPVTQPELP